MPFMKDLTGIRFSRLTAQWPAGSKLRTIQWLCLCDCGNMHVSPGWSLRYGNAKSCGCLHKEKAAATGRRNSVHGHTALSKRGGKVSSEYKSWRSMKERCLNPNSAHARYYSGRGITVCDRWLVFANFLADMGPRPDGTSLDRYPNNDGNYEPGNCRWATKEQQNQNKRKTYQKRAA